MHNHDNALLSAVVHFFAKVDGKFHYMIRLLTRFDMVEVLFKNPFFFSIFFRVQRLMNKEAKNLNVILMVQLNI